MALGDLGRVERAFAEAAIDPALWVRAEAKLAARLATGASLENISNELQISKQTGRTHLKRVFAKMGIGRQAELVSLLCTIVRYHAVDQVTSFELKRRGAPLGE